MVRDLDISPIAVKTLVYVRLPRCRDSERLRPNLARGLGLLFLLAAPRASATPSQVRVSFLGSAATTMGIAWTTTSGPAGATVEYGTRPGVYTARVSAKTTRVAGYGAVSEATLSGLRPDTRYVYRVGGGPGGWSDEHRFRTGPLEHPLCGEARFVAIGDSRAEGWQGDKGASDTWVALIDQAMRATSPPSFFIHTGDIVHDGRRPGQWRGQLTVTAPYSARVPFMYAIGNHDDGPGEGERAYYNRVLQLPRATGGSGTEDYYSFTYGNAIFVALSTVTFNTGAALAAQAAWLDRVLTRTPKRWRIVFLHHPIYTEDLLLNHPPDEVAQNATLVPVLNKHHVDLVFQGHNHFYERWAPSRCRDGASTVPCPSPSYDTGTVYITTGGGGAFPLFLAGGTNRVRLAASGAFHYVALHIKDNRLGLQTLDASAKLIDALTITKPPAASDPCRAPLDDDGAGPVEASLGLSPDGCSCRLQRPTGGDGLFLVLLALAALLLVRMRGSGP